MSEMNCTTHHWSCACREADMERWAAMKQAEVDALRAKLTEAEALLLRVSRGGSPAESYACEDDVRAFVAGLEGK